MGRKQSAPNPYLIFNKVVLFTIQEYLNRYSVEGAVLDPLHSKLKSSIDGYLVFHKFNQDESKQVVAVTQSEEFKRITNIQISDIVFALEMIKLYIEIVPKKNRPILNISDKKLIKGRATFAMDMIRLKGKDEDKHAEKKEIIDTTVVHTKHVFAYLFKEFVK